MDADGPTERWDADVVLADGSTTRVRPILPADGPALLAFHERQSRESIYFRFFSPRPRLSAADVDHMTTVDGLDRMAFVADRDGEMLGVARYDRYAGRPAAEVAFFTDDAHAGRGIATVLLEYLAAYAREVGIGRFEAHVLPSNRRMVRVFTAAGFEASSTFADGVIEVSLDIEPTAAAAEAMAARARASEREAVARLLEPRSIAVVGAGRDPRGIGHRTLRNLLHRPFAGAVYAVHPEASAIAGLRTHRSVREIPDDIDLAVICVPAPEVRSVLEDCGRAHVDAAVVISAGFAETGPEGAEREAELVATARRFGVRLLGPNCLGVINTDPAVALHATFTEIAPRPGSVGMLSQSGTLGAVILDRARRRGVGVSNFVAVGNKADLSGNDLLRYWADDDRTDVVLLYLESFGNPRRFGRNVREVARHKPVFAVRSGGHGAGAVTDLDDDTVDALLRQTGVVRVPTIAGLLDVALVASRQPIPGGPGTVIIGNSGGSASIAVDACIDAGLELVELPEVLRRRLDPLRLHGRGSCNPVDLPYDASADDYRQVADAVAADPSVDVVILVHAPYADDDTDDIEAMLDALHDAHPTTTIVACIYGPHDPVTAGGVPVFDFPDDAAHAVGRVVRHRSWLVGEEAGDILVLDAADEVAVAVRALLGTDRRRELDPLEARSVLAAGGVATVPVHVLASAGDLDGAVATGIAFDGSTPSPRTLSGPVAVKAVAHQPGATTRQTGVALDVGDVEELRDAVAGIEASLGAHAHPMIVQPMVVAGTDVRIAVEVHPVVGPVMRIGPGGSAARFAAAPRSVLPISDRRVAELVDSSGVAELLDADGRTAVEALARQLAAIVDAAPEIVELVCDPVIVRADGADVIEVRVVVEAVRRSEEPPVRRVGQA